MSKSTLKYAFIHALSAAAYIALIATLINYVPKTVDSVKPPLPAIAFLLTFVISAAVMGLLIFARPAMWYLDGKKKDALALAISTIAFLTIIAIIFFSILFTIQAGH